MKIHSRFLLSLICGLLVGLVAFGVVTQAGSAAPASQSATDQTVADHSECQKCHLDITESWSSSPHAHAFDDRVFQQRWVGLGEPGDCLLCHTTSYQSTDNSYAAPGVSCEACHGLVPLDHPPRIVSTRADTDYCGTCHTTTLHEWRLTGHATADVGCTDCHDPHSQKALFAVSDEMCINCHRDDMGPYLEDLHVQKDIGCVDCHALVIPPETPPLDGIVPTGHTFTITPATCVACHTDALHAGFSLPGYEAGAKAGNNSALKGDEKSTRQILTEQTKGSTQSLTPEQQVQVLEAALASNRLATLFQGGVVGLVLGGSTARFIGRNSRRSPDEPAPGDDADEP
jgi:predicted CXXCH cytochrome family protein